MPAWSYGSTWFPSFAFLRTPDGKVRAGIAVAVMLVCVAVLVLAHSRATNLQYLALYRAEVTVQTTAPSMLVLQQYSECDVRCTAAAELVREVARHLDKASDTKPTRDASERRTPLSTKQTDGDYTAAFAVLARHRRTLTNPTTKQYVFVDERVGTGDDATYVTRVHYDPKQVNVPLATAQRAVKAMCVSGRCDLKAIVSRPFAATNTTDKRYVVMDYPWYDPVDQREVTKRTLYYRYNQQLVIGSGYTLTQAVTKPNVALAALCLAVYAVFVGYLFVWPAVFLRHGKHLLALPFPGGKRVPDATIAACAVAVPCVFAGLVLVLATAHTSSIQRNVTVRQAVLARKLTELRYVAVMLGGLALALGFFASYQRKYESDILPAFTVAFLFSLLALLDTYGGNDSETVAAKVHVVRACVTCAVVTLLWLFVVLTIRWQLHP
jgi:hypothetical protein